MKIAVLKVKEKSTWASCQVISKNLLSSYRLLKTEHQCPLDIFEYSCSAHKIAEDLESIVKDLKKKKYGRLVVLDHYPYPIDLFVYLKQAFDSCEYYPEIFIHAYGCLTLWLNRLNGKDDFFKKCKLHFILASEAQKNLLGRYLKNSTNLSVINFPIDTSVFKVKKNHPALKAKLGFKPEERLLIFSGRAHIQKHLPLLLSSIAPILKEHPEIKFLFAGSFDDGQVPFLNYRYPYGTSAYLLEKALDDYQLREQFINLGPLSQKDLANYLSISDAFCSLSAYNDEDYGYAPLEGLCSGTTALITSWGGYKEFASPFVHYVKIRREYVNEVDSLFMSSTEIQMQLQYLLQRMPLSRQEISTYYHERFSIEATAQKLERLHSNHSAEHLQIKGKELLDYKEKRKYALDKYSYMEIYESYYN